MYIKHHRCVVIMGNFAEYVFCIKLLALAVVICVIARTKTIGKMQLLSWMESLNIGWFQKLLAKKNKTLSSYFIKLNTQHNNNNTTL